MLPKFDVATLMISHVLGLHSGYFKNEPYHNFSYSDPKSIQMNKKSTSAKNPVGAVY